MINRGDALLVVESGTGSVAAVVEPGDSIRIVRGESIRSFQALRDTMIPLNNGREFVKLFPDVSAALSRRLTPIELSVLFLVIPFIGMNSGILVHGNGEFVTRKYLVALTEGQYSTRALDRALSGLVAKGVLAKCYIRGKTAYIANPYLFQRGSKANATLLTLFDKAGWARG